MVRDVGKLAGVGRLTVIVESGGASGRDPSRGHVQPAAIWADNGCVAHGETRENWVMSLNVLGTGIVGTAIWIAECIVSWATTDSRLLGADIICISSFRCSMGQVDQLNACNGLQRGARVLWCLPVSADWT